MLLLPRKVLEPMSEDYPTTNPYPGIDPKSTSSALLCFRNIAPAAIPEKARLFTLLMGRAPKITVRGDAYDNQGNMVFTTGNYHEVRLYTLAHLVVSINSVLTTIHPLSTWDAIAMS